MRRFLIIVLGLCGAIVLSSCASYNTVEEKIDRLQELITAEKFDDAKEMLLEVMALKPTDSTVLLLGSRVYVGLDQIDSAMAYAKKLTALYPQNLSALRYFYGLCELTEDWKAQVTTIARIGDLEGSRVPYYEIIADLNFRRGHYATAMKVLRKILEVNPDSAQALFLMANSMASTQKTDSAIFYMEKLELVWPDRIQVLSNLAAFHASKREYDQAEYYFSKTTTLYPGYTAGWYGLGNVLMSRADTVGAKKAYWEVYVRDPYFLGVDSIARALGLLTGGNKPSN